MFSHHSHSGQFCRHAAGTLEEVVVAAISNGFTIYGLTEHVPRYDIQHLYPEEVDLSPSQLSETFDAFVHEAHRLKTAYKDKITLLVGLETEYITDKDLDCLEDILTRHERRIEYVVGSVHHANTIPIDFDAATFQRAVDSFSVPTDSQDGEAQERLFSAYFDAQFILMQRIHPEIIGHFDLCRLYHPAVRFQDHPKVWDKIKRNVGYAVEYGALFELNAAAFRKGWDDAYPASDIIEVIKSLGGQFTLSDDSHGPHAVGMNYGRLYQYVQRVGLCQLWYLGHGRDVNASGRRLMPILSDGDWCNKNTWGRVL